MRTPAELAALYRSQGRKVTPQRQCIFRVLHGDETHPSAEVVYESARREMETISLKTVYQTLNDLSDLGEIAALDLGTGTVRFDPNVERPHHHLVCRSCGAVRDVFVDLAGLELPAAHAQGYDVGSAEVVFRGRCGECRAVGPEPPGAPARTAAAGQR
ncbi:MAG: Fur family transcriptional regulator [Acidimicrobiales bacterium]